MGIRLEAKGLSGAVKDLEIVRADVVAVLEEIVEEGTHDVRKRARQLANKLVKVRTGRYRSSIREKINKAKLLGEVGTKLIYARMIEHGTEGLPGGVLTPKNKKWLTIPVGAKTKAGASRPITSFDITSWVPIPNRTSPTKILAFGKRGKSGKEKLLFILVKKVKIEGKHVFETAFKEKEPVIRDRARKKVRELVRAHA